MDRSTAGATSGATQTGTASRRARATTTLAITATLRPITSSVDGVDVDWAVVVGFTCGNATDGDWFDADPRTFGQHEGVRVVPH